MIHFSHSQGYVLRGGIRMMEFLKRLFCYHKWKMIGKPYLYDAGMTKRANVRCVKCGKFSDVDIFDTPKKRWD